MDSKSNPLYKKNDCVIYGTLKYVYYMLTAACVVTNDTLPSYLNFSKKQLVINTWHGGGLFKQIYGLGDEIQVKYNKLINKIHNSDIKLYLVSAKQWYEKILHNRFDYYGEVLNCGLPRNDIFFGDRSLVTAKIKEYYSIPQENGIVLYAPTFRGASSSANKSFLDNQPINIKLIQSVLQKKFNKPFTFIFRGHHLLSASFGDCINASNYPDMQELLAASDVFISDYSSCLWDFSLTKRPAFIYAPDFEEYSKKPGFESNYRDWPFPISQNNQELVDLIIDFDNKFYSDTCDYYHMNYGSYENGTASECVTKYINESLGN